MSGPRILNAAVVARIRSLPLKSPYDYKGELIGHIDALTEERHRLLNQAMAVMGDNLEWECDCAVCDMVREMVLKGDTWVG